MRIDAHQHYWETRRDDYGWLTPEQGVLFRDYLPSDLAEALKGHGFARSIAVQAAPSVEETLYLLDWSDREPSIAGVVGWLDFEAEDFGSRLAELRGRPKFVGIRPMIQDLPADWLLRPIVVEHMKLLEREGFPVDLQLRPFLLDSAAELMKRVPELRAVVDHIAKPAWGEPMDRWLVGLERLAAYPNVACKVSGLVPESPGAPWTTERLRPYADAVFAMFGADRVLYGSDWPVCLLSASYDEVIGAANELLPAAWTEEERAGFWGRNAAAFYRLG